MFYLAYKAKTINILKCAGCRSYSITLQNDSTCEIHEERIEYSYICEKCGSSGKVKIPDAFIIEEFATWEMLEERIDELKAGMTLGDLE